MRTTWNMCWNGDWSGTMRCGISRRLTPRTMPYIVGGRIAKAHSWPWQCAIMKNNGHMLQCGCSIVTPDWIITAAHCK